MITSFEKSSEGNPTLLSHTEVITFFHEFGHVMHNMATEATISRFSGTKVEKDFLELPSQMLGNWIWDKDVIELVSKHYITGEKMPEDLLEGMKKFKQVGYILNTLEQIFLGSFDLMLYSASDEKM